MIVAGVIIETLPGQADAVAAGLAGIEGVTIQGGDGDRRLAAVWAASSGAAFVHEAEDLLRTSESIVGIYPTFVAEADESEV